MYSIACHYVAQRNLEINELLLMAGLIIGLTIAIDYCRVSVISKGDFYEYINTEALQYYLMGSRIPFCITFLLVGSGSEFFSAIIVSSLILLAFYSVVASIWVAEKGKRNSIIEQQATLAAILLALIPNAFQVLILLLLTFYI